MMNIAIATGYVGCRNHPRPQLKLAAEAGYTHIHWAHHFMTDFMYSRSEIRAIKRWFRDYKLVLLDIHGAEGIEKCWYSPVEYERQAGVELVKNRLEMFQELEGTGCVMMHAPHYKYGDTSEKRRQKTRKVKALRRSLDELMPLLAEHHLKLAIENTMNDTWELISQLMEDYPPELLGICFDCGHANFKAEDGFINMERLKDRLMAVHLDDNDGEQDKHQPPFMGTVDWERVTDLIARSSYHREASFELDMWHTPFFEMAQEDAGKVQTPQATRRFLADAFERGQRVAKMIADKRRNLG